MQASRLPDRLEVWEAIDLYATCYDAPADPAELLELLGLTESRDTRFTKLSGGQQQRLSIALALVGRPQVAVLDELTTGLGPQARRDTWALDTPAAIVSRAGGEHRLRFMPSAPVDRQRLAELAEVARVEQEQDAVAVTGNEQTLQAVMAWLFREQIVAHQLRVDQPNLDDAFVALTGRSLDDADHEAAER